MDLSKIYNALLLISVWLILGQCNIPGRRQEKKPILLADREAPLGWIYLRIYDDSTFEFESRGLERKGSIYPGRVDLKGDTIFFNYTDSIPRAGKTAVLTSNSVWYIDGEYPERIEIKLNKMKK